MQREIKVGLLVLVALVTLAAAIFLLGERQNLFRRSDRYFIQFQSAGGLEAGSPVQLSGVTVGRVEEVVLPQDAKEEMLTVWITLDRRYDQRVRVDSLARIKTLGLLGDKYVDITSGSPDQPPVPAGGEIPAAPITDVDKIIASGGDVVENIMAVSVSLRNILSRMERGEGLLGVLAVDTEAGRDTKESLLAALNSVERIAAKIDSGQGTVGRLLTDATLADRLQQTVERLDGVLTSFETGQGALPALLHDPATRDSVQQVLGHVDEVTGELSQLVGELREGKGLLPRLLNDPEYGEKLAGELEQLIRNLDEAAGKLNRGEGTAGLLLNDSQVYDALNDILVGVDESKMLRWLIRNRQKSGIEQRYRESQQGEGGN